MSRLKQFIAVAGLLGAVLVSLSPVLLVSRGASAAGPVITDQDVGRGIYLVRCSTCHGPNGEGTKGHQIPATGPALKGDPFVTASPDQIVIDVIRHGRTGAKRHYDDTFPNMPSFDASMIEDIRPLIAYLKGDMQKAN